ncbi:MAG: hypothetical protein RIB30_21100 [Thalassospira sp.]|uniref:hypothetical protein n=1 Tax=Thalassospira sp. TaxID=1912094 RepID=UPI0032EFC80C
MHNQPLRIDFDKVRSILRNGITRADLFMGIGLNASTHQPAISHNLTNNSGIHIQFTKETLTDDETKHVNEEFGKWIISNGLRELLETFSIFLLNLYIAVYLLADQKTKDSIKITPKKFEKLGISQQLIIISEIIEVNDDDLNIINSLNQLRNCYAHRNGRVGAKDLNEETKKFSVSWTKIHTMIEEPDGTISNIEDKIGVPLKGGENVFSKVEIETVHFELNDEALVTKKQAKEICLSVFSIGERAFNNTVKFAQKMGAVEFKP